MQSLYRQKLFLILYVLFPLLLLVVACGPSAGSNAPEEVSVAVKFAKDRLTPDTVQVKQGDTVTLRLDTDRPGAFHLHGYDLERAATVGTVTDFQFVADATGRFRITFHGSDDETDNPGHDSAAPDSGGTDTAGQGHHGGDTKSQEVGGHDEQESVTEELAELEVGFLEVLPR